MQDAINDGARIKVGVPQTENPDWRKPFGVLSGWSPLSFEVHLEIT